jgi:hypothetical protein
VRIRSRAAASAAAMLACGIIAATANAAATTLAEPFVTEMISCTGEPVVLEGTIHTKTTVNLPPSGGGMTSTEINLSGVTGTGMLSGARYVDSRQYTETSRFSPDPTGGSTGTVEFSEVLNRQGEDGLLVVGDDLHARLLVHVTFNASGNPTATKVEAPPPECR